jgi:hypothetical protein
MAPAAAPVPTPPLAPPIESKEEILDDAREAVNQAIVAEPQSQPLPPVEALNAQPIDLNAPAMTPPSLNGVNPNIPGHLLPQDKPTDATVGNTTNPAAPPPVPPPMLVPNDNQPGAL